MVVFFDCWDTLLKFNKKTDLWNIMPLLNHAKNKNAIDWNEVNKYCQDFLHRYYFPNALYEIDFTQLINLLTIQFSISLDCDIETCKEEVLNGLNPTAIDGCDEFLTFLDKNNVRYCILSNTIYGEKETLDFVSSLLPGHKFEFILGSSKIGVKKPNKDFFSCGLKLADVSKEEAIYIGDSFLQDVCGSFDAGFKRSIWFNHKKKNIEDFKIFRPDIESVKYIEISTYKELSDIWEQL